MLTPALPPAACHPLACPPGWWAAGDALIVGTPLPRRLSASPGLVAFGCAGRDTGVAMVNFGPRRRNAQTHVGCGRASEGLRFSREAKTGTEGGGRLHEGTLKPVVFLACFWF